MEIIVLILTLSGYVNGGQEIQVIENFTSIKSCEKAGQKWLDKQDKNRALSHNFVCIEK